MALNKEDKQDVKKAFGSAKANAISHATKDGPGQFKHLHRPMTHDEKWGKLNSQMRNGQNDSDHARSKALKAKTGEKTPKHYRGNTNSEGGVPFGKKPD